MEMHWLAAHGVSSSFEEYCRLPLGVLEDCRELMLAEQNAALSAKGRAG